MDRKLRIGLLVNDHALPAWAINMVERINAADYADIVLLVRKANKTKKEKALHKRAWQRRDEFLFKLYAQLEKKIFKPKPDAFALRDVTRVVDCDELAVEVRETKFSDYFSDADIAQIKTYDIDVFVRLGFRILRGEILRSAKYGVWSYHHGDNSENRGGPPGAWEVLQSWDETGVTLQVLTENLDGGMVLAKSFSSTNHLSINKNKNSYYWKSALLLPRKLKELHTLGEQAFFEMVERENDSPQFYSKRLYTAPGNVELGTKVLKNYTRAAWRKLREQFYLKQWILLFQFNREEHISSSFFRFKRILPPKDRYWADPFVIEREGKYHIFVEEFKYAEKKGKIAMLVMDQNGNYGPPQVVLEKDYHLSYPFLIEDGGELYMMPETRQNRTIELYRCVTFPSQWELVKVLMDGVQAVDATIFKQDGTYWLFTNIAENEGASTLDELFLFYSDTLLTDQWHPHPLNPIVSDVRNARPAGNVFPYKDRLFRPAQNCGKHYGYGMHVNEITTLTRDDYQERTVEAINPTWANDLISTHTINHTKQFTVIDAMIKRRR